MFDVTAVLYSVSVVSMTVETDEVNDEISYVVICRRRC